MAFIGSDTKLWRGVDSVEPAFLWCRLPKRAPSCPCQSIAGAACQAAMPFACTATHAQYLDLWAPRRCRSYVSRTRPADAACTSHSSAVRWPCPRLAATATLPRSHGRAFRSSTNLSTPNQGFLFSSSLRSSARLAATCSSCALDCEARACGDGASFAIEASFCACAFSCCVFACF